MQNAVKQFMDQHQLFCGIASRYIDLTSETGELGKEILKSTAYGSCKFQLTGSFADEAGDCLFALLALMCEAGINAEESLHAALAKYERRFAQNGSIASGKQI